MDNGYTEFNIVDILLIRNTIKSDKNYPKNVDFYLSYLIYLKTTIRFVNKSLFKQICNNNFINEELNNIYKCLTTPS